MRLHLIMKLFITHTLKPKGSDTAINITLEDKIMDTVTQQNQQNRQIFKIKILTSFYCELKEQGFSISVCDGEIFNSASSLDDILVLCHLDEIYFTLRRGDYIACATLMFGNVGCCMYDYTDLLEDFLTKTNELIGPEDCSESEKEKNYIDFSSYCL